MSGDVQLNKDRIRYVFVIIWDAQVKMVVKKKAAAQDRNVVAPVQCVVTYYLPGNSIIFRFHAIRNG